MSETYAKIKETLFPSPLPHFPDDLQEKWQIAILLRRKYLAPPEVPVDDLYLMIISDIQQICEAWRYDDTLMNLLLEVYDDISRQLDPQRRDSRIRLLLKHLKDDYEKHNSC